MSEHAEHTAKQSSKTNTGRSVAEIRRDLAQEAQNITQAAEQIGEQLREKLAWRSYVRENPYWSIGIAAGAGYLASGIFVTRSNSLERIMRTIADEVGDSVKHRHRRDRGSSWINAALLGILTNTTSSWIKNAAAQASVSGSAPEKPQSGSNINPE